jgi:8-oxo-dGTP pyrophosphatase MutT (NUDIX family)
MIKKLESSAVRAPAPAVPSASVVLIRDHDDALETYVLHRHASMPFAAGMVVFPGGRLDRVDQVGQQEVDHDAELRRCAVRETEEETGVRLERSALQPWAHWITPEIEPRRYDTYFYLAPLPAGQQAADVSGEAWLAEWRRPPDLLRAADHGELALMPPTRSVLIELAECDAVAAVVAACEGRSVEPVLPRPVRGPDGWLFDYGSGADQ